uniref:NADH-ubiquinone oxidoreductase chain 2 n=1 Tax=Agrilinae sp. 5 ACP-2013 TaxID=1434408 RepID=A0A3G3FXB8_9COLE|nr:NADH dehydrogenase subunit 2 [Agrilinae sp. 5 ACP-2013]
MKYLYKLLFSTMLLLSTLLTISTNSWVTMWIGLEINLLSFIPLMKEKMNMRASEASMKYFITQAMASIILLTALLNNCVIESFSSNLIINTPTLMITLSALITKTGAAPFHFWFPEVIEGMSWTNALILLTWQKLAPLSMILYLKNTNWLMISIVSSIIVGSIIGLNQTSLRKILAYSSINHLGWILSASMFSKSIWIIYFIFYCLTSIFLILQFKIFNMNHLNQFFMVPMSKTSSKMMFTMNFFTLGGIPPFIGFLPKWLTIQVLMENKLIILSIFLILVSLITLFYYIRIMLIPLTMSPTFSSMQSFEMKPKKMMSTLNLIFMFSLILNPNVINWA